MPTLSATPLSASLEQQLAELELPVLPVLTDTMDSIPMLSMDACIRDSAQPPARNTAENAEVAEQPLQTLIAETAQSVLEELLHEYTPRLEAELRLRLRERIEQIIQQQLSP